VAVPVARPIPGEIGNAGDTVEVTGSNPVSPAPFFFNNLRNPAPRQNKCCVRISVQIQVQKLADQIVNMLVVGGYTFPSIFTGRGAPS